MSKSRIETLDSKAGAIAKRLDAMPDAQHSSPRGRALWDQMCALCKERDFLRIFEPDDTPKESE